VGRVHLPTIGTVDNARQMLSIARRDLKALGGMLDADVFAYEIFGFHAQQAAEKAS
jgi:hypothetical protein